LRRAALAIAACFALLPTSGLADWTTYHLDQARTGNDTTEPAATTVTNAWNTTLNGQVYAEPLIVGSTVLVATEQNNVYALDAGTGAILWQNTSLGAPIASGLPCGNISPVGITGTPVVDTASGLMYVVASLAQPSNHYELYAIDISDGSTAWHETIAPTNFNFAYQGQRGALALANGRIYIPFGGRSGDCGTYSGWVVGAPAGGPGALLTYSLPYGHMGGIWAPSGSAVDGSGNIFVTTGNTSCGSNCNPFDYGETVLKLSPTLGLLDYWAPTNYASLNASDTDVGSVGPSLIPNNLIFQVGKAGIGYLINAAVMGHISNATFSATACPGLTSDAAFGGTAWAAPYMYVACRTKLVALNVNTSGPSFTVVSPWSAPAVSYSGPPIVAGGYVWTIDPAGHLYGLNPTSGAVVYNLAITSANHFATPTSGTGRLFVPASNVIRAYSLVPLPALAMNPRNLSFPNQAQGTTSPAQPSTITNAGNAPLTISAIAATGDFAQTNNCPVGPATLAAGASCTVQVTFTPTAAGTRTGTVSITDDATGSPHRVALIGFNLPFTGAYTLDGFGGLHANGGSPPMTDSAYWPGWNIARSAALLTDGSGGYVLDGYGGAHAFGSTSAVATSYFGWNIARDIAFLPNATASSPQGYTLDGYGGIHAFGGAPAVQGAPYWPGFDIARRLVVLSDGTGGYVLDGYGGLHPFSTGTNPMPTSITNESYWGGWNIARDVALAPGSTGTSVSGVTLDGWGGVHPFGNSGAVTGATASWANWDIARAVRYSPDSTAGSPKGWVLDGYGGLHAFGGAANVPAGAYFGWDIATQLILR